MREAGLRTWLDAVGNVHGRVDGRARDAPALILGSHYDTVMDAGKYDGALGIIVAIASVKASILQVRRRMAAQCCVPLCKRRCWTFSQSVALADPQRRTMSCTHLRMLACTLCPFCCTSCMAKQQPWFVVSGCTSLHVGTVQAALDARIMRPEEVRAAVRESADLGQWLGNKVHKLFGSPLEIVAFSDEEGVRCYIFLGLPSQVNECAPLGCDAKYSGLKLVLNPSHSEHPLRRILGHLLGVTLRTPFSCSIGTEEQRPQHICAPVCIL